MANSSPALSDSTSPDASGRAMSSVASSISGPPRMNSPTSNAPKAILSCDFCRQRKTKCDKAEGGCSNCKRAGIKCNMPTRQRLPRGRNGGRTKVDAELKARVGRLESLVRSLGGNEKLDAESLERALSNTSVKDTPPKDDFPSPKEPIRKTSSGGSELGKYLGSTFWTSLTDEVTGLRDVLDNNSDDEQEPDESSRSTPSASNSNATDSFSFVLCTSDGMFVNPEVLQHPPKYMISGLCDVYLRAVDPVFKVIHRPSLIKFMKEGQPYLNYSPHHVAPQALAFAVYFAAVSCQADEDCQAEFGNTKATLVDKYRIALETALSRADLLITNDLTVLTAFLLLIIFSRVSSNDRRSWTLTSVAVRIAHAINLSREDAQPDLKPFEKEMRRRVWNAIGIVDGQAAGDRGTDPLIPSYTDRLHTTPPPHNINDDDMNPNDQVDYTSREEITDMSFSLVCRLADVAMLKLVFNNFDGELAYDWETRRSFASEWRRTMHDQFLRHLNMTRLMDQVIFTVIEVIAIDLMLNAIRPIKKHLKANTPRVSGDYILSLSASALEKSQDMMTNNYFRDFLWFGRQYTQWHAIAVMAAELCVHRQGPAVERAWGIMDKSLNYYKETVADSESGMLWRPIEKLIKRAREIRRQGGASPATQQQSSLPARTNQNQRQNTRPSHPPPETANAAMAFPDYLTAPMPSIDFSSSSSDTRSQAEADQWQLPPDFMNVDMNFKCITPAPCGDSPENAWQNWGCFTDGLQNEDPLFPGMQVDDLPITGGGGGQGCVPTGVLANSPHPWFWGQTNHGG